ncbi:hypothetical protein SZN_13502 [Streptomyces zinciresistens K42]|uniref:Uncharacterized protein n=1 Tax=Streptomyces zinciresistens K42 TaxID=700597 RepID=G2GB27_9ACTN|nr:hypothetical protein [Streptomyces zinciresistens]EGX59319.1 hypothetical protein SZN_13502 [Streptomyces zinciresistens K42]
MRTRTPRCPKCRTVETFRLLGRQEGAAVREEEGPGACPDDPRRCTGKGCRTYYPRFHEAGHGLLPERSGEEKAAAGE